MTAEIIPSERTDTSIRTEQNPTAYEVHVNGDNEDLGMFMCCNGGWDVQATLCGFKGSSAESRDDETTCGAEKGAAVVDNTLQGITSTVSKEFERSGSGANREDSETVPVDDCLKSTQPIKKVRTMESVKSASSNGDIMSKLDQDLFVGSVRRVRYESFKTMIDNAANTHGASSLQVADLYASMGTDLLENNADDKTSKECAVVLFEEAFHIFQTRSGDSDGRTIDMKIRLGRSLFACGRHDEALKHYCQAVYMREALLGELHPSVSDIWVLIADVHQKKKKMEMALRANAKALTGYRNAHGDKHFTVINVLKSIAKLHIDMGNHDKAEDINKYVRIHSKAKK